MRILFVVLAGLLLAGCGSEGGPALLDQTSPVEEAHASCDETVTMAAGSADNVVLGDEGHSIVFTGTFPSEEDFTFLACVLTQLETSEAIVAQMDSTTAMMGRQTVEEEGFTYSWSYHPDNGINMTITD